MARKHLSVFLLIVVLTLAACRRAENVVELPTPAYPAPGTPPASATPIIATPAGSPVASPTNAATPSPIAPTTTTAAATATSQAATVAPPTATSISPTPTPDFGPPPGGSARITFAPGATSAVVQSTLANAGDTDTWILRVQAGQVVTVQTISSAPGAVVVRLGDMSGGVLATNPDTVGISAAVPTTGDYQISFSTPNAAPQVAYTAQVFIPAAGGPVTPTRINFAPGATSAQLDDSLAAGGDLNSYVLTVGAGQSISAAVFASVPAVTNINVRNSAGQQIAAGTDMSGVSATATNAGDYYIDVSSSAAAPALTYRLTVTAPPIVWPPSARITFAPGATSAQLDDSLAAGGDLNQYVLFVGAGQSVNVAVFGSVPAVSNIAIRNSAGQIIGSGTDMTGANATAAVAGDIFIDVSSGSGAPALTYRLTVTVPPISPPPPPQQPARIEFGPGQTGSFHDGLVVAGGGEARYIIHLLAGQTLITNVNDNPIGNVEIAILDTAATLLNLGQAPTSLATFVPANGDYIISLNTPSAAPVSYSLEVVVPPLPQDNATRITFAPGATSAEVAGGLDFAGDLDYWVIQAQAGQTMQIDIGASQAGWLDAYVYNPAGDIIAIGDDSATIFAPLATNGDYLIVINTTFGAPPITYTMSVEIQ